MFDSGLSKPAQATGCSRFAIFATEAQTCTSHLQGARRSAVAQQSAGDNAPALRDCSSYTNLKPPPPAAALRQQIKTLCLAGGVVWRWQA